MDLKLTKQPDGYWVAIDADNYEAESDSQGWWSKSPAGWGKTELEAIRELLADIEDRTLAPACLAEAQRRQEQDK
jgi:sugar (pentulose or hexulose) kinase